MKIGSFDNRKAKIPLQEHYIILLENSSVSLDTKKSLIHLATSEIQFSYSVKSKFIYLCEYFGSTPLTRENFRFLMYQLREGEGDKKEPLSKATLNKYILVAKYIDEFLKLNVIKDYPLYKKLGQQKSHGELLSDGEMKRISEVYVHRPHYKRQLNWKINRMMRAAFTIMRFTGMPPDDLVNLKWSSDYGNHFKVFRNKTDRERIVPIVPEMRNALDELCRFSHGYIIAYNEKGHISTNMLREDLRKRCEVLGIKKKISPYSFRYSMITECYANAGDGMVPKIAEISGHSIQTAMKHYNKQNVKVVADALYSTHPGLIHRQKIDNIKRLIVKMLEPLVDFSKFNVRIEITPKEKDKRVINLS